MQLHEVLTLADFDVVKAIMTVLVPALWLIAQLMSARNQAKPRPPAKKPAAPVPAVPKPAAGQDPPPRPNSLEEALRREVDDFLNRAQGKPVAEQTNRPPKERPKLTPALESAAAGQAKEIQKQRDRTSTRIEPLAESKPLMGPSLPSEAAKKTAPLGEPNWGVTVSDHVAQHMAGGAIQSLSEHLGEEVAHADERLEQHLHSVFDHQLGSFSARKQKQARGSQHSPIVNEVRDLIRQPGGMRQLIVANEILQRRENRL